MVFTLIHWSSTLQNTASQRDHITNVLVENTGLRKGIEALDKISSLRESKLRQSNVKRRKGPFGLNTMTTTL
jgi:hypothetical protein